jgi:hypothetical protein
MAYLYLATTSLLAHCTSPYSVLHQERLYLLQALAAEEERGKRLTQALKRIKSKLEKSDCADPPVSPRRLKQSIKSIRNKISNNQFRERTLAVSLANVAARIEGMKRYQWGNSQQSHQVQRLMMAPAVADFTLQSSLAGDVTTQIQYLAMTSPTQPQLYLPPGSVNSYLVGSQSQVPQCPVSFPSTSCATSMGFNLPTNPQVNLVGVEQSEPESSFAQSVDAISPFDVSSPLTLPDEDFGSEPVSRLSKDQQRPWSWPSVDNLDQANNENPNDEAQHAHGGLGQRLSSLDATSSGIRLDRLSRNNLGQHSM